MINLTKALVASGLLLSISGCNQQFMDCLSNNSVNSSSIYGIDAGGSPTTTKGIDAGGSPVSTYGIDAGGSPVTTNGIDAGGSPITTNGIDAGGSPFSTYGIDAGGSPSSTKSYTTSSDAAITECLRHLNAMERENLFGK